MEILHVVEDSIVTGQHWRGRSMWRVPDLSEVARHTSALEKSACVYELKEVLYSSAHLGPQHHPLEIFQTERNIEREHDLFLTTDTWQVYSRVRGNTEANEVSRRGSVHKETFANFLPRSHQPRR